MKYFIASLILLLSVGCYGQTTRLSNHFFVNPSVYNPAFVGYDAYALAHVNHRKQWRGIDGAPTTTSLFLHVPFKRVSLGLNAFREENGIFELSSFQTTFAFLAPFNEYHGIRFGLSAGVGMNAIDLNRVNTNDPAIMNVLDRTSNLNGDFGFVYYFKSLYLGFTMSDLLENQLVSTTEFNEVNFFPSKSYTALLKYTIPLSGKRLTFEPNLIYRMYPDETSQYEGIGILHFFNTVWLGGSYRKDYGITTLAGINIKDNMKLGYAYELAGRQVSSYAHGSHEFHLTIRLGKKKELFAKKGKKDEVSSSGEKVKQIEKEVKDQESEKEQPQKEVHQTKPVEDTPKELPEDFPLEEDTIVPQKTDESGDTPVRLTRGKHLLELNHGHYVVVGAFKNFDNAQSYSDKLFMQGYPNSFGYNSDKQLYYVTLYAGQSAEEARAKRDSARQKPKFKDAWYLLVE